jgi:hypothetical protein
MVIMKKYEEHIVIVVTVPNALLKREDVQVPLCQVTKAGKTITFPRFFSFLKHVCMHLSFFFYVELFETQGGTNGHVANIYALLIRRISIHLSL